MLFRLASSILDPPVMLEYRSVYTLLRCKPIAAGLFRPEEGAVGSGNQRFGGVTGAVTGHPGRDGDEVLAGDRVGANGVEQPFSEPLRFVQLGLWRDDDKLLAPPAAQGTACPQLLSQAVRDFAEYLVADRVTKPIVKAFEMVNVND